MSFLSELKRRNVIRVALLYVVGAWLVLQVGEVLFELLEVPAWGLKLVFGMLLLGFVPVVVFSWIYEITPEGIKKEKEVDPSDSVTAQTAKKLNLAVIVLLMAVGGMVVVDHFRDANRPATGADGTAGSDDSEPAAVAGRSIAVLPFADMSPEGDQAYFADGISEELLNLLARIDELKVAARTSSFKFRGEQSDVAEIGAALKVDTILEGSVRKAGNQVRITAQLIDAKGGFHLWSDSYDRELDNIFAVQDEIAAAIVDALKLELDLARETASRTSNVEAYDRYLRARQLAREPSRSELLRAVELYREAIALDPAFAAAYGGIAEAWIWLEDYGGVRSAEAFPKAEQAARRALELDPGLAEAHAAMAFVQDRYYHDALAAESYFEKTLEINPNHVQAYNLYADTLRDMGRTERMFEVARKAAELDPLSMFLSSRVAQKLMENSRFDEAQVLIDEILAQDPNNDYGTEELANLRSAQGRLAEAMGHYQRLHDLRPGDPFAAAQLSMQALSLDELKLADYWIDQARQRGEDNRWELLARQTRAWALGDWEELHRVGALSGGYFGSAQQGWALIQQDRLAEARQAFISALRLSGYRESADLILPHVEGLLGLAWLDYREGLDSWKTRAESARRFLLSLESDGLRLVEYSALGQRLAGLALLLDDRDAALVHLERAMDKGFRRHWFLERDPYFEDWRDDPGFLVIVADMKRLVAEERARLPEDLRGR